MTQRALCQGCLPSTICSLTLPPYCLCRLRVTYLVTSVTGALSTYISRRLFNHLTPLFLTGRKTKSILGYWLSPYPGKTNKSPYPWGTVCRRENPSGAVLPLSPCARNASLDPVKQELLPWLVTRPRTISLLKLARLCISGSTMPKPRNFLFAGKDVNPLPRSILGTDHQFHQCAVARYPYYPPSRNGRNDLFYKIL